MRKKLITILCIFSISIITGCGEKNEGQITSNETDKKAIEESSNVESSLKEFEPLLSGAETFIDVERNQPFTISNYQIKTIDDKTVQAFWKEYIVADVDKDGKNELIVRVDKDKEKETADVSVRVLDKQEGTYYCYSYPYRGILNVYKNGVMEGSSGTQDSIYYTAEYAKMESRDIRDAESISSFENEVSEVKYYIGEDTVSEKKFYDYIKKYDENNRINWSQTNHPQ